MPPAENMPDFDKMSPEEIMAWMETLAKRQGANMEELTTSADVEIAEIDPDTVVIDEPGYVPYGEERPAKPEKPAPKPEPAAPPPPTPQAPPARPAAAAPIQPPARQPAAPPPAPPARPAAAAPMQPPARQPSAPPPAPPKAEPAQPAASRPIAEPTLPSAPQPPAAKVPPPQEPLPLPTMDEADDVFETKISATGAADAMAWLESLAADQGDSMFNLDNLDLSALSEELESVNEPVQAESHSSPMDFLNSLTSSGGETAPSPAAATPAAETPWHAPEPEPPAPEPEAISDPFAAGVDPMAWLEELARRQGAKSEELTTSTRMNIPTPENAVVDEPGYKPFSFDAPIESRKPPVREPEPEPLQLENPADWLGSLAEAQGFDETVIGAKPEPASLNVEDIERAIAAGTVSPEQMQYYLEHQTDRYIETIGDGEEVEEEEAPPVPAELPDWLLEQVGAPPAPSDNAPAATPALVEDIQEPPPVADMPDWLKEDVSADGGLDFDIFADTEEAAPAAPPAPADQSDVLVEPFAFASSVEVDPNDPWVEAFDIEHEQGAVDITSVPDWYTANLSDPKRIAAVEAIARGEAEELADTLLPAESELPAGEPTAVPDWLAEGATVQAEDEPIAAEIPDWLREMEVGVEPDAVPDWLMEEPAPIVVEETPDWLREEPAAVAETPDWLAEFAPQAPEPEPIIVAAPPPAPKPVQPPAPPPPVNISATLDNARSLSKAGSVAESLAEYENLIRQNRELQFVVDDLTSLVKVHKENPAVFRVLGDGLMRQGKLQAALDIYREALNQL